MHLLPGLTAIALGAAVALVARPPSGTSALAGRGRIAMIAATVAIAIAGLTTIAPRFLSARAQTTAQHALAQRAPRAAIGDASTALQYDGSSVPALTLRAAGFA